MASSSVGAGFNGESLSCQVPLRLWAHMEEFKEQEFPTETPPRPPGTRGKERSWFDPRVLAAVRQTRIFLTGTCCSPGPHDLGYLWDASCFLLWLGPSP